jgi:hypothetical protein
LYTAAYEQLPVVPTAVALNVIERLEVFVHAMPNWFALPESSAVRRRKPRRVRQLILQQSCARGRGYGVIAGAIACANIDGGLPEASVTAVLPCGKVTPAFDVNVTVAPDTGLSNLSRTVTWRVLKSPPISVACGVPEIAVIVAGVLDGPMMPAPKEMRPVELVESGGAYRGMLPGNSLFSTAPVGEEHRLSDRGKFGPCRIDGTEEWQFPVPRSYHVIQRTSTVAWSTGEVKSTDRTLVVSVTPIALPSCLQTSRSLAVDAGENGRASRNFKSRRYIAQLRLIARLKASPLRPY